MALNIHLVGRILMAAGGALLAGAFQLPDGTAGSPRALAGLAAGILMAIGAVLLVPEASDAQGQGQPPA